MDKCEQHCRVLGVQVGTTQDEIKGAYRREAKKWHPDSFHGDSQKQREAEERIKAINAAYDICASAGCHQVSHTNNARKKKQRPSLNTNLSIALHTHDLSFITRKVFVLPKKGNIRRQLMLFQAPFVLTQNI